MSDNRKARSEKKSKVNRKNLAKKIDKNESTKNYKIVENEDEATILRYMNKENKTDPNSINNKKEDKSI